MLDSKLGTEGRFSLYLGRLPQPLGGYFIDSVVPHRSRSQFEITCCHNIGTRQDAATARVRAMAEAGEAGLTRSTAMRECDRREADDQQQPGASLGNCGQVADGERCGWFSAGYGFGWFGRKPDLNRSEHCREWRHRAAFRRPDPSRNHG